MRNTVLGLLIFGVLSNGLNLLPNIPITFKQALQGIVLLAALLNELLPLLASFEADGFAAWRDAWLALDAFANQRVVLRAGDTQWAGVARGVDVRGALQLETATGMQSVHGGEISLRAAP